jgi:hypothetical protein
MRPELDVVAEALGTPEPVRPERARERTQERTAVFARLGTNEPTAVFERPSSMYPLAHADVDAQNDALEPTEVFDPEETIRRVDVVPAINAQARVVKWRPTNLHVRAKGTEPPVVSHRRFR